MIRNRLLQKYFIIALACLLVFLYIGFKLHFVLMTQFTQMPAEPQQLNPPLFIAKIIDRLSPDKVAAITEYQSLQPDRQIRTLALINQAGTVLYPKDFQLPFDWGRTPKPQNTHEFTEVAMGPQQDQNMPPPPPPPGNMFFAPPNMPNGPPPPHMLFQNSFLVKLSSPEAIYLLIMPPKMPPNRNGMPKPPTPWIGIISLLISLGLGIAVAIALINYSVSKKVREADEVISALQSGDLNARFKVNRLDEFGQAMIRFNRMADEIKKLVDHLRQVESARTKLIQELAHDLRTPIASLRNLQETLKFKNDKLDAATKAELQDLSLQEIEYFQRLVEDLLFLAQVSEPKYRAQKTDVDITTILKEELESIEDRYRHLSDNKISFEFDAPESFNIVGDAQLLKRLFRNALENAASFASSQVKVICKKTSNSYSLTIQDNGPGFSAESLQHFGERKFSRKIDHRKNSRISLGLGSVVMKTICDTFGARLQADNLTNSAGAITGAEVKIIFTS